MKINDIITLTQAGWTKDDIISLVNTEAQDQQPDPQPEQPAAQPEQPAAQPAPVSVDERLNNMQTQLDYVVNRFNYLAVQQSSQPEQPQETIEDILSSVVRGVKDNK